MARLRRAPRQCQQAGAGCLGFVPHSECHKRLARWSLGISACLLTALATAHVRAEPSELPPEIGFNYGEIETPRHTGVSGAQRALSHSATALFTNPANIRKTRVYHIAALTQIWPEADRWTYGAAIVDSMSNSLGIAGAIGGTWNIQDSDGLDRQFTDLRFALAFPASDSILIGAGGRYLWLSQDGVGTQALQPSLASSGLKDERIVKGFAFDAGLTIKPSEEFMLAIVGSNLNKPDHGFQPLHVGGGIGYGGDLFTLEADLVFDFVTWQRTRLLAMGGGELLLGDHFALRAGYRYDQGAQSHAASLGAGYIDTSYAFEAAARRVLSGDIATAITIGFTFHIESTGLGASPADTF